MREIIHKIPEYEHYMGLKYFDILEYASSAHEAMKQRYGGYPYSVHLKAVETVLFRFGYLHDEELIYAAWLHDVIEDTRATYGSVKRLAGVKVADIVYAVTDEPGINRKERKAKTYPKIKGKEKPTILKLADRIANIEFGIRNVNGGKIDMYRKEQNGFRKGVYVPGIADEMWDYLEFLIKPRKL